MVALFANNAFSTLASGIGTGALSLTVDSGDGALFPSPTGSDYFYATLIDTAGNLEIVKCTSRTGDVLTIVRAQEGTAAVAYSSGDRIELRLTAAGLTDVITQTAALLDSFDDRYLGAKAVAPTLDNDGDALIDGALYYNTTNNSMYVYDLGTTAWIFTASDPATATAAAASASAAAVSADEAAASAASIALPLAVASGGTGGTTQGTARTGLGLGTAAVANTGVANGNVPAMDATGYPAANGSQITALNASALASGTVAAARLPAGSTIQTVATQAGDVAVGTGTTPADNTIPQNTEGDEYMTRAITPTSATSILEIAVTAHVAHSSSGTSVAVALHQDSVVDALAVGGKNIQGAGSHRVITFTHRMVAGTTSATTFKVRIGSSAAGTLTFNGTAGARLYGGVMASSIIIREIAA